MIGGQDTALVMQSHSVCEEVVMQKGRQGLPYTKVVYKMTLPDAPDITGETLALLLLLVVTYNGGLDPLVANDFNFI